MVSMTKDDVVALMTNHIVEVNIKAATEQGMPQNQIEALLEQMLPQLNLINGNLYDLLVDNGVIG